MLKRKLKILEEPKKESRNLSKNRIESIAALLIQRFISAAKAEEQEQPI